jgi:succinyl-CoA synthetase (ADP-forming) alpha subunit (EC 6.2.1.5)
MAILVDKNTRVVVQGITGKEGSFHALQCKAYGTQVVAGVTPGKGEQKVEDIPVFNTVESAVKETSANCSLIFVPPTFAADAIVEALDAGIELIVCITEGIPVRDMLKVKHYMLRNYPTATLIGPNSPPSYHTGRGKGRHNARAHIQEGDHRDRLKERNANLRGVPSAYPLWAWAIYRGGYRRRPCAWAIPQGCDCYVQRGPRDGGYTYDR